jgi:hypothetical protein
MIDIPPAIAQEAQDYVALEGKSLEKMFLDFLTAELQRRRNAATLISEFDTLVEKTSARRDKPYVFNRADAYEEVMG